MPYGYGPPSLTATVARDAQRTAARRADDFAKGHAAGEKAERARIRRELRNWLTFAVNLPGKARHEVIEAIDRIVPEEK